MTVLKTFLVHGLTFSRDLHNMAMYNLRFSLGACGCWQALLGSILWVAAEEQTNPWPNHTADMHVSKSQRCDTLAVVYVQK